MKTLTLLTLVGFTSLLTPRVKGQFERGSGFWWVKLEENSEPENIASDVTKTHGNNPDPSHLNRNFGNGFSTGTGETSIQPKVGGCTSAGFVCVPYYQCEENQVITDGSSLIDIRVEDTVIGHHKECPRYLEVCCKLPNDTSTVKPPTVPHSPGCGRRNKNGVHANVRGLNNTQTQYGEYPWMVAVLRIEKILGNDVNLYVCGGSLLQPNIVLTAAHCVGNYEASSLKIRAGEWDTTSDYEVFPHEDRLVKQVIIHPDYNGGSLWNDFAILILDTLLILGPSIDTICLPSQNEVFDNVTCIATGWGKDKFGKDGRFQNILKQVSLKIVPDDTCEAALKRTRLGTHFILDDSFVCAGGEEGVDTCKGDGGSPLVCTRPQSGKDIYYQVGIVAWGIGCGENGVPGVYADVTKAVEWIFNVTTPYLRL